VGDLNAVGLPTLNAWVVSEATENQRVFERNPYFWHVDSKGQQLPYIDRLTTNIVVDADAITNSIIAGEVDMASGAEVTLSKMPVYQQNAEQGGYRTFLTGSFNNPVMVYLNKDFGIAEEGNVWQQLISDPEHRFARAFAAAMDPEEINKAVYFGVYGEPFLNNTELDLDLANQLLDELGMEMDGDYRLGPDGQPFLIELTNPGESADFAPVAELIREQLAAAGLRVDVNNVSFELFEQRKTNNELTASLHWNDGPGWPSGISEDYLPNHKGPWSPETWKYYSSNGESGVEPGEKMQEFYDIHRERKTVPPESEEGQELWAQMEAWFMENYPFIPTTGKRTSVNVVNTRLRNVPNENAPFEQDTYINAEGAWYAEE
jgi:peptide/nickel transport system substrate-binding protein